MEQMVNFDEIEKVLLQRGNIVSREHCNREMKTLISDFTDIKTKLAVLIVKQEVTNKWLSVIGVSAIGGIVAAVFAMILK